jgi:hypothetical protein
LMSFRTPQFVNPLVGSNNPLMKRAEGVFDRGGRGAVAAALYHTGTVTLARLAAQSLVAGADAWANVRDTTLDGAGTARAMCVVCARCVRVACAVCVRCACGVCAVCVRCACGVCAVCVRCVLVSACVTYFIFWTAGSPWRESLARSSARAFADL